MNRRPSNGFTLVELLVVIVILGLLLALLFPGLGAIWQTAHLTKCKVNLNHIWQAQNTRRADLGLFATGQGWVSVLLPYLEGDRDTFVCPAAEGGIPSTAIPPSTNAAFTPKSGSPMYDLVPELTYYEGFGKKFGVPKGEKGGGSGGYGDSFLQPDGSYVIGYEDWTDYDYNDIVFHIWPPSTGSFRVILLKVVTAGDFKIYKDGELLYPSAKAVPKPCTIVDIPSVELLASDYGMSRGVYETSNFKATRIDPRLIFILDYPKEVADYSFNTDDWPQFFIKDPADWEKDYGQAAEKWGYTWRTFQSLRHFGKANVLFCDGRVETVGVDAYGTATPNEVLSGRYLDETNPLWKYQGD